MKNFRKILSLILSVLMLLPVFSLLALAEETTECEHEYTVTEVAPTCVEDGYKLYVCTKCGSSYKDFTGCPTALGHNYGEWYEVDAANCVTEGHMRRDCARCGASEIKTIPAFGHKDANFDGKCDVCGEKVKLKLIFSPFDWLKALFRAISEWLGRLFA